MTINRYFAQGSISEQRLYEDIIIESLKIYGQDTYYIPREIVNRDRIFDDDVVSRFDNSYKIEMYIENVEGFDGEGDLFSKFGVEIRDACTFICARRRWENEVAQYESDTDKPFFRPREGDLIYLTLSGSMFEVTSVEDETPFYQLNNLPVFRIRAELFAYNDEDFETGVDVIDSVEKIHSQTQIMTFPLTSITGTFELGEFVTQVNGTYTMKGEILDIDYSDSGNAKLYIGHQGATDGEYHVWTTINPITGDKSGATITPVTIQENIPFDVQNDDFEIVADDIIDFSESNPFGEP